MAPFCDQLVGPLARKLRPGDGDLARVRDYGEQATYLGQIALALGAWRSVGGDDRYDAPRRALCDALHVALVAADGGMLQSFPTYAWTFDTIPSLVALRLDDVANGVTRSTAAIRRHLAWMQAHLDPVTLLPPSALGDSGKPDKPPRGCELTLRIALLAQLDPESARTLYARTVAALWRERALMRGFAEYPEDARGQPDMDSGPIIQGVGLAATGFGVAAALACDDTPRVAMLAQQIADLAVLRRQFGPMIQAMAGQCLGGVKLDDRYVTGFVFGDASLFYATTWCSWPGTALPIEGR